MLVHLLSLCVAVNSVVQFWSVATKLIPNKFALWSHMKLLACMLTTMYLSLFSVFRVYISVSCWGRFYPLLVKTWDSRDCSLNTRTSWSCCATNNTHWLIMKPVWVRPSSAWLGSSKLTVFINLGSLRCCSGWDLKKHMACFSGNFKNSQSTAFQAPGLVSAAAHWAQRGAYSFFSFLFLITISVWAFVCIPVKCLFSGLCTSLPPS